VENLPEARIVVQNDRFLTDPDEPLGKHICDFEHNDRTTLQSVWSRRALSKANSELRLRPEKPKEKFNQLLREIQNGKDYGGVFYPNAYNLSHFSAFAIQRPTGNH
jgi:hypothetical protein